MWARKRSIFIESRRNNHLIFSIFHTNLQTNLAIYEHKGFEIYQEYRLNGDGPLIWLMKKETTC